MQKVIVSYFLTDILC